MKDNVSVTIVLFVRFLIVNGEFKYEYHTAKSDMSTAFQTCKTNNGSLFVYNQNDPIPCKEAQLETKGDPTRIWIANYKRFSPWIYFRGCYFVDTKAPTINVDSISECVAQCSTDKQNSSVIAYNKGNRLCACQNDIITCGNSVPPNVCTGAVILGRNTYLIFEVVSLNLKSSHCHVVQTAIHSTNTSECGLAIPYTYENLRELNIANCYSGYIYDKVAGYFKLLVDDIAIEEIQDPVSCSVLKACGRSDSSTSVEDAPCNRVIFGFVCEIEYTPVPTTASITTHDVHTRSIISTDINKGETITYATATETTAVRPSVSNSDISTESNKGETVPYSTETTSVRPSNEINTKNNKVVAPVVGTFGGLLFTVLMIILVVKIRKYRTNQSGKDHFKDVKDDKKKFNNYDEISDINERMDSRKREYQNPAYHVDQEMLDQDCFTNNIENSHDKQPRDKTNLHNDQPRKQIKDLQNSQSTTMKAAQVPINSERLTMKAAQVPINSRSDTYMHFDFQND